LSSARCQPGRPAIEYYTYLVYVTQDRDRHDVDRSGKVVVRLPSVELLFRTNKLAKICSTEAEMVRKFGPDMARRLQARLTELDQATCLAEMRRLPHARAHQLIRDRDEQISFDVAHPNRLIVEVNDDPVPRLQDGGLDWGAITSLVVVEITDTHE
jgi:plasmid maintenance system killer protein